MLLYGHVASPELVAVCVKIGAFIYPWVHMDKYIYIYIYAFCCMYVFMCNFSKTQFVPKYTINFGWKGNLLPFRLSIFALCDLIGLG